MAIKNISTVIELGSDWALVDLEGLNSFYLIGVKEEKGATDTIDPKDVKILNFEVGVESGIKDADEKPVYLSIGHLTLNFDEFTSKNESINKVTAMTRYLNYPSTFYIRPSDVVTYDNIRYVEGTVDIDVNINALKLF